MSNEESFMVGFVSASEPERRPSPEFIRQVADLVTIELANRAQQSEASAQRKRAEAWERYIDETTDGEGLSEEGLAEARRELAELTGE